MRILLLSLAIAVLLGPDQVGSRSFLVGQRNSTDLVSEENIGDFSRQGVSDREPSGLEVGEGDNRQLDAHFDASNGPYNNVTSLNTRGDSNSTLSDRNKSRHYETSGLNSGIKGTDERTSFQQDVDDRNSSRQPQNEGHFQWQESNDGGVEVQDEDDASGVHVDFVEHGIIDSEFSGLGSSGAYGADADGDDEDFSGYDASGGYFYDYDASGMEYKERVARQRDSRGFDDIFFSGQDATHSISKLFSWYDASGMYFLDQEASGSGYSGMDSGDTDSRKTEANDKDSRGKDFSEQEVRQDSADIYFRDQNASDFSRGGVNGTDFGEQETDSEGLRLPDASSQDFLEDETVTEDQRSPSVSSQNFRDDERVTEDFGPPHVSSQASREQEGNDEDRTSLEASTHDHSETAVS